MRLHRSSPVLCRLHQPRVYPIAAVWIPHDSHSAENRAKAAAKSDLAARLPATGCAPTIAVPALPIDTTAPTTTEAAAMPRRTGGELLIAAPNSPPHYRSRQNKYAGTSDTLSGCAGGILTYSQWPRAPTESKTGLLSLYTDCVSSWRAFHRLIRWLYAHFSFSFFLNASTSSSPSILIPISETDPIGSCSPTLAQFTLDKRTTLASTT